MSISLLGAINVCKVNTGWADKIQSDRFENPNNMLCPLWNGQDTYGRFVAPDSFYTKTPGCASADDRVEVENFLRPQYMEYVALDAAGFKAPLYAGYPPAGFPNVPGYQNGTRISNPVVENYAMLTGQASPSQFTLDATCTRRDALNQYNNVGSAGFDYGKSNTLTDKGLNGVNGGGNVGCGQWFNQCPPQLVRAEFYQPDQQSAANFAQRQALSGIADFRASAQRTWAGM